MHSVLKPQWLAPKGVREWGCGGVGEWGCGGVEEWGSGGGGEWESGGVGNYISWMCRKEVHDEGVGERPASHGIFIFQSHPSPGLPVSFLCLYCSFPLPTLTLHVSVKSKREQVFQVIQLIVFLFTGYVIGQFSLHPTMLFHSKIIFKARKRKPTTTTDRRYSFILVQ